MGMLTVIILFLMTGTDGPPVTVLPNTGLPPVTMIKACAGENKLLVTKDESAHGDILTYEWTFRSKDASITTNYETLCQKTTSGGFKVNPSYSSKIEQCGTTGILLKNISLHDMGYYKLLFLQEKMGNAEGLTVFLAVSDTPTEQCKPVIRNHSRNMLNCSTPCGHIDVEWRLNKGGYVVGNESILPIDCLWKNEVLLCCLQSKAMECYKGGELELCTQTTPSYCTEDIPGENGYDIHAAKVPDNPGNNLLGLLALLIIPGIPGVIYFLHQKKIILWTTFCQIKNKSIPRRFVNTQEETFPMFPTVQEPHADVNYVQVPEKTFPQLETDQELHVNIEHLHVPERTSQLFGSVHELEADVQLVQVQEKTSPFLGTVQELDVDVKHVEEQEKTFPISEIDQDLNADAQQVQVEEMIPPILGIVQELDVDVQHVQVQDPEHETEKAGTEHQPSTNSETTKEIQELRHAAMCKICFASKMSVLFMPCKHIATCGKCCIALKQCPVCRALIIEKIMNIRYD